MEQTQDVRFLKALVIGLGVLIVIGTLLVGGVIIKRIYDASSSQPLERPSEMVTAGAPYHLALPVGAGAKILGVTAAGDRLGVWVSGTNGGHIVIVDPGTGTVTGTIGLKPEGSVSTP